MAESVCPACGVAAEPNGGGPGGARCVACGAALTTPAVVPGARAAGRSGVHSRTVTGFRLPLSTAIIDLTRSHRVAGMAAPQRLVFALLVRTLQGYRSDRFMVVFGFVMMPFFASVGVIGGILSMTGGSLVLTWLGRWTDVDLGYVLYAIPLFVVVFSLWSRSLEHDREVVLRYERGKVDGLELGRLHEIFETAEPSTLGLFLGICFGVQWGLLRFAPDHVGLPIVGGWMECALLTLDNACHGIFLDTFELYDIHSGEELVHNFWSATVFYAFRLSFDAFAFLYIFGAYRRYRLRLLFRGFPNEPTRIADLLDWIEARCGDEHRWPRRFFDEFLFLMLAKEYLRGHLTLVRHVSLQFHNLAVSEDVRSAFVGPRGNLIFQRRVAPRSQPAAKPKGDRSLLD